MLGLIKCELIASLMLLVLLSNCQAQADLKSNSGGVKAPSSLLLDAVKPPTNQVVSDLQQAAAAQPNGSKNEDDADYVDDSYYYDLEEEGTENTDNEKASALEPIDNNNKMNDYPNDPADYNKQQIDIAPGDMHYEEDDPEETDQVEFNDHNVPSHHHSSTAVQAATNSPPDMLKTNSASSYNVKNLRLVLVICLISLLSFILVLTIILLAVYNCRQRSQRNKKQPPGSDSNVKFNYTAVEQADA